MARRKQFKLLIAGGRDFTDLRLLVDRCNEFISDKGKNVVIISGTAGGADRLGEAYAYSHGFAVERHPAPWGDIEGKPSHELGIGKNGMYYWKLAGHFRNAQMAEVCDAAVIFWDGKSKGTKNMINCLKKIGKPHIVVEYGIGANQLKLEL